MRALVFACFLVMAASGRCAMPGAPSRPEWRTVTFHIERAGVQPTQYTIELQNDGVGVYWEGPPPFNMEEAPGVQKIKVFDSMIDKAGAALSVVKGGNCETHLKNLAQTGRKTVVFGMEGASATCEFNYSDEERLRVVTDAFMSIAETMQFGGRLAHERRFDRLALDAELESLADEVKAGRAIELQNIAPVLQGIVGDERLMERVRSKAAHLLESASMAK